jgi:hypothetical protein
MLTSCNWYDISTKNVNSKNKRRFVEYRCLSYIHFKILLLVSNQGFKVF